MNFENDINIDQEVERYKMKLKIENYEDNCDMIIDLLYRFMSSKESEYRIRTTTGYNNRCWSIIFNRVPHLYISNRLNNHALEIYIKNEYFTSLERPNLQLKDLEYSLNMSDYYPSNYIKNIWENKDKFIINESYSFYHEEQDKIFKNFLNHLNNEL